MEYKKSWKGFVIWLVLFCAASFAPAFLPITDIKLIVAIVDNIMTIGVFIMTLMIYLADRVYWYTGVSFEDAAKAGPERRKKYAFDSMKRFGIFALAFLIYSIVSHFTGIPMAFDIAVAVVGLVATAASTVGIKL